MLSEEIARVRTPYLGSANAMGNYYAKQQSNDIKIEPHTTLSALSNPYALITEKQNALQNSYMQLRKKPLNKRMIMAAPGVLPNAYEQLRGGVDKVRSLYSADTADVQANILWNGVKRLFGGAMQNRFGIDGNLVPNYVAQVLEAEDRFQPGHQGGIRFRGLFDRDFRANEIQDNRKNSQSASEQQSINSGYGYEEEDKEMEEGQDYVADQLFRQLGLNSDDVSKMRHYEDGGFMFSDVPPSSEYQQSEKQSETGRMLFNFQTNKWERLSHPQIDQHDPHLFDISAEDSV